MVMITNEMIDYCRKHFERLATNTTYGACSTLFTMDDLKLKENYKMIDIYRRKQRNHISNIFSTKREEIFNENEDLKKLNYLVKKYKLPVFIDPIDFMNEDQKTRLLEIDNQEKQEYDKLDDLLCEVKAQLDMCETYEQKQNIYKLYNIINEEGKINV